MGSHLGLTVPETFWGTSPLAPVMSVPLPPAPVPTPSDPGPALPWEDPHLTHLHSEPRSGQTPPTLRPQNHFYFHHMNSWQIGA